VGSGLNPLPSFNKVIGPMSAIEHMWREAMGYDEPRRRLPFDKYWADAERQVANF
jgi:hypothetical protein